jgi:hypothetical protein
MVRWIFFGIAIAAPASLWGTGQPYMLLAAFLVLFGNFATFCLLYDMPMNQARSRVKERLRTLQPNSDLAQRLESAPIRLTSTDKRLALSPLTVSSLATGIAACVLLIWGLVSRIV